MLITNGISAKVQIQIDDCHYHYSIFVLAKFFKRIHFSCILSFICILLFVPAREMDYSSIVLVFSFQCPFFEHSRKEKLEQARNPI